MSSHTQRVYYISSGEYLQQSNGFRAPFHLCHILNESGFEAYVTAQKQVPGLKTPLLTPGVIDKHRADGRETVAVYTEAMWRNALRGDIVVRWILNTIGKLFDERDFPDDLFFYWAARFAKNEQTAVCLETPYVDESIFYTDDSENGKREGFAYYALKYFRDYNGQLPAQIKDNGISLCQDIPRTHDEIAGILRSVKVLYCFEESAIMPEAAACGCTVVLVKTPYISYIGRELSCVDCIIDIGDIDIQQDITYTGKSFSDFHSNKADIEAGISNFIHTTQQAEIKPDISTGKDPLLQFCEQNSDIFIYGTGLTSDVVYNTLSAAGVQMKGFVVSDEQFSEACNSKHNLPVIPFSDFLTINNPMTGVVTAMISQYARQVLPVLERYSIKVYNPVLF